MYIINTILGFLIAQISDILKGKKENKNPNSFDLWYFLKDTWQKLVLSLILSLLISIAVNINLSDFIQYKVEFFGKELEINKLIFLTIGAFPEIILQKIRKKYGYFKTGGELPTDDDEGKS